MHKISDICRSVAFNDLVANSHTASNDKKKTETKLKMQSAKRNAKRNAQAPVNTICQRI